MCLNEKLATPQELNNSCATLNSSRAADFRCKLSHPKSDHSALAPVIAQVWLLSLEGRLCSPSSTYIQLIHLLQRYSVRIQQQFLNTTQAKPVLAAAETRVGGLQVWESIHTALTDRISRKHCHRQNVISHHSFSYSNCFGLYHKITFISKTLLTVTT